MFVIFPLFLKKTGPKNRPVSLLAPRELVPRGKQATIQNSRIIAAWMNIDQLLNSQEKYFIYANNIRTVRKVNRRLLGNLTLIRY
jgi:hypothetical protein